jgi:hypothetical protein
MTSKPERANQLPRSRRQDVQEMIRRANNKQPSRLALKNGFNEWRVCQIVGSSQLIQAGFRGN